MQAPKKEQESWSGRTDEREQICSCLCERGEGMRLAPGEQGLNAFTQNSFIQLQWTTFMCLPKTLRTKYHEKGLVFGLVHYKALKNTGEFLLVCSRGL